MKIAYIIPQFPVGTETFAVSDVNALAALGHDVTIFTLKPPNAEVTRLRAQVHLATGVEVASWRVLPVDLCALARSLRASAAIATRDFRLASEAFAISPRVAAIVQAIRRRGFDVVHAFWGRHPSLVLDGLSRGRAPPLLSVFVGAYDLVADDALVALGLARADIRFTHAETNRSYFVERGYEDVRVVHRGIPIENLKAAEVKANRLRILTVSALDPRKNIEGVIRSFALAKTQSGEPLSLEIVGDGPDHARLQCIVDELGLADSVRFLGHLSRHDVFARMCAAQTFLFLSHKPSERFPNVVKEALLAGCYVVASDTPGIGKLVRDGVLGTIVPAGDLRTAAAALLQATSETSERTARRRRAAKRLIVGRWSSARLMQCYASAWKTALADSKEGHRP